MLSRRSVHHVGHSGRAFDSYSPSAAAIARAQFQNPAFEMQILCVVVELFGNHCECVWNHIEQTIDHRRAEFCAAYESEGTAVVSWPRWMAREVHLAHFRAIESVR